jgi:hypothetical protein
MGEQAGKIGLGLIVGEGVQIVVPESGNQELVMTIDDPNAGRWQLAYFDGDDLRALDHNRRVPEWPPIRAVYDAHVGNRQSVECGYGNVRYRHQHREEVDQGPHHNRAFRSGVIFETTSHAPP